MTRRIGQLNTPEECQHECQRVYRDAHKGKIAWADATQAAAVLSKLPTMIATNGDTEQGEAKWNDVGPNAVHSRKA